MIHSSVSGKDSLLKCLSGVNWVGVDKQPPPPPPPFYNHVWNKSIRGKSDRIGHWFSCGALVFILTALACRYEDGMFCTRPPAWVLTCWWGCWNPAPSSCQLTSASQLLSGELDRSRKPVSIQMFPTDFWRKQTEQKHVYSCFYFEKLVLFFRRQIMHKVLGEKRSMEKIRGKDVSFFEWVHPSNYFQKTSQICRWGGGGGNGVGLKFIYYFI